MLPPLSSDAYYESQPRNHAGPDPPKAEYDTYGTELGPDARVWPTYVREADRFDQELVDKWNKLVSMIADYIICVANFRYSCRDLDVKLGMMSNYAESPLLLTPLILVAAAA